MVLIVTMCRHKNWSKDLGNLLKSRGMDQQVAKRYDGYSNLEFFLLRADKPGSHGKGNDVGAQIFNCRDGVGSDWWDVSVESMMEAVVQIELRRGMKRLVDAVVEDRVDDDEESRSRDKGQKGRRRVVSAKKCDCDCVDGNPKGKVVENVKGNSL